MFNITPGQRRLLFDLCVKLHERMFGAPQRPYENPNTPLAKGKLPGHTSSDFTRKRAFVYVDTDDVWREHDWRKHMMREREHDFHVHVESPLLYEGFFNVPKLYQRVQRGKVTNMSTIQFRGSVGDLATDVASLLRDDQIDFFISAIRQRVVERKADERLFQSVEAIGRAVNVTTYTDGHSEQRARLLFHDPVDAAKAAELLRNAKRGG